MKRLLAIHFVLAICCSAAPLPSPLFSDHAVLQRGVPVPVWGTADPGENIAVRFRGAMRETTADSAGKWRVTLPSMPAGPGEDLVVEGGVSFTASDVAVGDVWICAGQSNMEWPVEKSDDFAAVTEKADRPWLRELKIPRFAARAPQSSFKASWRVCSPALVGSFSAVAYQFVTQLYPDGNVPVGILNLSYGGTRVEQWMSPTALEGSLSGRNVLARWETDARAYPALQAKYEIDLSAWEKRRDEALAAEKKFPERPPAKPAGKPGHYTQPSALYFGMVSPLQGFPAAGLVWYQGESNVLHPGEYEDLLTNFLKDIRTKWGAPELPVFVVQLPLFDERKLPGQRWAQIRAAQDRVTAAMPNTHLAVIVDVGNPLDKHPTNKTEVGRRLALLAKREVFGEDVPAHAPQARSAKVLGDLVEVGFDTGGALVLRDHAVGGKAFEIAGADGVFRPAEATLKGENAISLRAAGVSSPVRVRYLQYDAPHCVLFNKDGLPARPFALDAGP